MRITVRCLLVSCLCVFGCIEPYHQPDIQNQTGMVVVDGYIDVNHQSATVKLTRTISIDTTITPPVVSNASLTIESEDGSQIPLQETNSGTYEITQQAFDTNVRYRLNIRLSNNDTFLSDFITLKRTPEIDSITFKEYDDGIRILVDTHQPDGTGQYYKWDYVETWEYVSSFFSNYKVVDHEAIPRTIEERVYMCWDSTASTRILVSNSLALSQDLISDFPITYIAGGTVQLTRRYSIKVRQRALTKEEYNYWSELQRTTEQIGGLFDPQPYPLPGNMHSANNDQIVLGFFGGGEVTEKRIFIE